MCIKLNCVGQGIPARKTFCDNINLLCRYSDICSVSGIDSCRIADGILHLQLQRVLSCVDIKPVPVCPRDSGNNVGMRIAKHILSDAYDCVAVKAAAICNRGCDIRICFPYGFSVLLCGGRSSAQFRRKSHHNGGDVAGDPVRLNHCDLVEAVERLVVREIRGLPLVLFCGVAVRIDTQCVAQLKPETLRVVLGIELAKPTLFLMCNSKLCPVDRILREKIRYGRLIDMCVDLAAGRAEVVCHDVGSAVRQYLQIAHVLARSFHIVRENGTTLLRTCQFAALAELGDIDGRIVLIAGPVVVLISADTGDEDLVVELVETSLIDVAADACIAAELQTAVTLYLILHEKAVVIGLIAAERVDGGCHIQILPVNEQCLTVYLCLIRVADIGFVVVDILEGFVEIVAAVLLDIIFEVDSGSGIFPQPRAELACNTDLSKIIARHIDIFITCCCRMHIRHGTCLSFCYSRRGPCRVGVDEKTVFQLCRAVCILPHQQHALAILMEIKGCRIAVEVLQHAGLRRRIDLCCHARAGHRSHLAPAVVRRNG